VITRYADIEQVFGDPDTYSAAVAQAPLTSLVAEAQRILLAGGHKPQPSMVSLDEPAHARLRGRRAAPRPGPGTHPLHDPDSPEEVTAERAHPRRRVRSLLPGPTHRCVV